MACGRSLLTWFNLPFPSLFNPGLHLGKCCSRQHLDITPDFSSGVSTSLWQPPAPPDPLSHCPCILGMSSQVSFPLPNQFSLLRVPCVLTLRRLSRVRGQQLAWPRHRSTHSIIEQDRCPVWAHLSVRAPHPHDIGAMIMPNLQLRNLRPEFNNCLKILLLIQGLCWAPWRPEKSQDCVPYNQPVRSLT